MPSRLEEKASSLEAWAEDLRRHAKAHWLLPSREEWLEANRRFAEEFCSWHEPVEAPGEGEAPF